VNRGRLLELYSPGWLGRTLECHASIDSTNDRARALLEELGPAAHGAVVFADEQSGGRGRLGRSWHSPGGSGIAVSLALWPDLPPEELSCVPLAGSLAVAEAIRSASGAEASLKWPNDVLLGGRKVAGILVESRFQGDRLAGLVMGIGVNLSQRATDFPDELRPSATSLFLATGVEPEPEAFAAMLLQALQSEFDAGKRSGSVWVRRAAARWIHKRGDSLEVSLGDRLIRGRFDGVSNDGALILEVDGKQRAVHHGEVVRVRPAGVSTD
jgi:BirA family biotin operon repressor/biotin-[acetyl-CoA-carboxylase] ligase